ncbi:hypothetical protein BC629DRAFT_1591930 [Irpex lacteus]|nr:hypothetical protein BC629DRAFT_1591930 [Irpex lacteus]
MGDADAGPSRPSQRSEPTKSEWSDSNADSDFERERADEDEEDVHSDIDSGVYEDADDGMPTPNSKVKGKRRAYAANGTTSPPISPTQSFSRSSPQPQQQSSRSWTDLNMSILVALISPIGNWLTGSDHVKHLCLLLLLIYYLHQLIEVPWQLYHKSRTRPSAVQQLRNGVDEAKDAAHRAAHLAISELRRLELFYLLLSVLAPFLGAQLIRHIFTAMEVDSLSWFSQTLFVLATGVRPWSHLIERLSQRASHLQEAVHALSNEEKQHTVDQALTTILSRLDALEEIVRDVHGRTEEMETTKEIYEDLTEAVGDLDRLVHRHERKMELARVAHNNRLAVLETGLQRVEERSRHSNRTMHHRHPLHKDVESEYHLSFLTRVQDLLRRMSELVLSYLPSYLLKQRPRPSSSHSRSHSPLHSPSTPSPQRPLTSTSTTIPSPSSGMAMPYFNGTPLETIAEDSDSSEETYVAETYPLSPGPLSPTSSTIKLKSFDNQSRSRSRSRSRKPAEHSASYGYSVQAMELAASVAGWPYRVVAGLLTNVLPSSLTK